jgi:hypothetical protein
MSTPVSCSQRLVYNTSRLSLLHSSLGVGNGSIVAAMGWGSGMPNSMPTPCIAAFITVASRPRKCLKTLIAYHRWAKLQVHDFKCSNGLHPEGRRFERCTAHHTRSGPCFALARARQCNRFSTFFKPAFDPLLQPLSDDPEPPVCPLAHLTDLILKSTKGLREMRMG